ncbi:hypothetical protein R2325_16950 [Mycobacteroides chelonae]|uniref:hypothetical protein n=1 Tax=Mycobacteroides chelonae TaxID=1774 RepID=UPI002DE45A7E|nr:hypothetical protein [Mycobacteroides chelonae]MEC4871706.1 hypothetical protein [Mycobacteroides chelonae]
MARVCYHANESYFSRADQGYYIAKITEGKAGYEPLRGHHRQLSDAVLIADGFNKEQGHTPDDVAHIVASSMRQGPIRGFDEVVSDTWNANRDL